MVVSRVFPLDNSFIPTVMQYEVFTKTHYTLHRVSTEPPENSFLETQGAGTIKQTVS